MSATTRLRQGYVLGVGAQLAAAGLLLTSAWLIVRAAQHPPVLYLMVAIVAVRFFGLSRAVLRYAERLRTHDAVLEQGVEDRVEVYRDLDWVAPQGTPSVRRGDVVDRVVADVASLQDAVLRVRAPWIAAVGAGVAVVVLVGRLAPTAGIVLAAYLVTCCVALRVVVPRAVRAARTAAAGARAHLLADAAHVALTGPDLVAYGAAAARRDQLRRSSAALVAEQRRVAWAGGLGSALVLVATGLAVLAVVLVTPGLPVVLAGVVLLAPVALVEPLDGLAEAERIRPGVDDARTRLTELATLPATVVEPGDALALPSRFDVTVDDLVVGWDRPLVEPVSFALAEGDVVAVAGPSGVGKSTLALTLMRLLEPQAGTVRLGGVDVRRLTGADVRTRVGLLAQDESVLDTSIRENLRVADPELSEAMAMAALDLAGLGDLVRALPDGLGTLVGERGSRLSGGERQRLALARLLLSGQRVLVLDEPTEHLDEPAARRLLDDLVALAPSRTIVVVSHTPWVLERVGRVVELRRRRQGRRQGDAWAS